MQPPEPGAYAAPVSILAVIALYETPADESIAFKTLLAALEATPPGCLHFHLLLVDNSPAAQPPSALPDCVSYQVSPGNQGLYGAYTAAAALARSQSFAWLLTLDQDTALPVRFLSRLAEIAHSLDSDATVAAIYPSIMQAGRHLSPNWFLFDYFPRPFAAGLTGFAPHPAHGFNSAATIRVSALDAVGGYHPFFWLDYSDAYLCLRFQQARFRCWLAGDLIVEHQLSILDPAAVSDARYLNLLTAQSAFHDLMRGRLMGLEFTVRLARAYLAQIVHHGSAGKKEAVVQLIRKRLFQSRKSRLLDLEQRRP